MDLKLIQIEEGYYKIFDEKSYLYLKGNYWIEEISEATIFISKEKAMARCFQLQNLENALKKK